MSAVFSRSRAAWYTLVLVTAGTGGGIYAIHRSQQTERERQQHRLHFRRSPAGKVELHIQLLLQLQALRDELTLTEATGRDILTLLKWEKCAHKQVKQSHRLLEQEHLVLQQKYSSVTARAEADSQGTKELLFRLSNVEQEIPTFKTDLALYREQSRQLRKENSRLRQELQRREVMFEGLSLRLRNAFDTNGLLRRALDEAKKSLLETAKEVQLLKMQQAGSVNPEEPSKPAMLNPPSTLTPASNSSSQIKRAAMAGASPIITKRTAFGDVTNFEGFSRAEAKMPGPLSSPAPSQPPAFPPSHRAGVSPSPMLTPASLLSSRVKRTSLAEASPAPTHRTPLGNVTNAQVKRVSLDVAPPPTTTPKHTPVGNITNCQGFSRVQGKMPGLMSSPASSPLPAFPSPLPDRQPLPSALPPTATPRSGRMFQRQEQHCIKGPSSSCSTHDSNSGMAAVSAHKLTKSESSFQLAFTPLARTETAGTASPSSAVLATASRFDSPRPCAAGDADLSGLMLLCAAADTLSPPPSDTVGSVQLDKAAGLMLLCKAGLGSPLPVGPASPAHVGSSIVEDSPASTPSEHGAKGNVSSSRRISNGSLTSPATSTRTALSGNQSRRPSWSITGPNSHAANGGLTPPSARGTRPAPTASAASKLAATACLSSPQLAAGTQSSSPCHSAAVVSAEASSSRLMLPCAAADRIQACYDHADGYGHLDCANPMPLGDLAASSPSQMLLTSPFDTISSRTGADPASTPINSNGRQAARPAISIVNPCTPAAADMSPGQGRSSPKPAALIPSTAAPGPTCRSAVRSTARTKSGIVQPDRLRSGPTTRSTAATTGLSMTAVAAPAPRMLTRGQAAAATRQAQAVPASSGAPASSGRKQKRSLKPEAPTRRQLQRAAKPQWR
ncbi:hypothetical protein ABBQ32_000349 [Trebouxia sp. C0010 RCD-2024]